MIMKPNNAQNIAGGSMQVNDINQQISYLIGQSERHTEQLQNINSLTQGLQDQITDVQNNVFEMNERSNERIDKAFTQIDAKVNSISGKLDDQVNRLSDKIDSNFKWTIATLTMPIITMVITIIVEVILKD